MWLAAAPAATASSGGSGMDGRAALSRAGASTRGEVSRRVRAKQCCAFCARTLLKWSLRPAMQGRGRVRAVGDGRRRSSSPFGAGAPSVVSHERLPMNSLPVAAITADASGGRRRHGSVYCGDRPLTGSRSTRRLLTGPHCCSIDRGDLRIGKKERGSFQIVPPPPLHAAVAVDL